MNRYKANFIAALIPAAVILVFLFTGGCAAATVPAAPTPAQSPAVPSDMAQATAPVPSPAPVAAGSVTINLVTQGMAFDKKVITVPAGAEVTVNFENRDKVGHNLAIYIDKSAAKSIFIGEIIAGKAVIYKFTAPSIPGTYFFRCDPHAATMYGDFVVTGS